MMLTSLSTTKITQQERNDFAARVRNIKPDVRMRRLVRELIASLPQEQVVTLTADLWRQHEPARRRRRQIYRWYSAVSFYPVLILLPCAQLVFLRYRENVPFWFYLFAIFSFAALCLTGLLNKWVMRPEQHGCLLLLEALQDTRLTPALIDALDCYEIIGADKGHFALRRALVTLLPAYTNSDALPLDAYQQQVLHRDVRRCVKRIGRSVSVLDAATAEFVVVALRCLSTYSAHATVEKRAKENYALLVRNLSDLPRTKAESSNVRFVRETAQDCLAVQQTGSQ